MLIFGTHLFGKVDAVPGLFYVKSQFFHLYFMPLIPTRSYLIFDGTEQDENFQGVWIRFSVKSAAKGWLRAFLILIAVVMIILALLGLMDRWFPMDTQLPLSLAQLGCAGICFVFFFISRKWWLRVTPERALELAAQAGIPSEELAKHFVDDETFGMSHDKSSYPNKSHS